MNISALYEKLEALAARLPPGLQTPILREISPIKTLFLQQRPPRILLLGDRAASRSTFVNALFGEAAAMPEEDHVQAGAWQIFASTQGKLRVLDARRPVALSLIRRALATDTPDLCIYLQSGAISDSHAAEDMQRLRELLTPDQPGAKVLPTYGVVMDLPPAEAEQTRHSLHATLESGEGNPLTNHLTGTYILSLGQDEVHQFAAAIAGNLPGEAKLEMARLSGVRELQRELAGLLIKSTAAVCGVVGTQPIPLADFPILTMLQAAMVSGIMDISGRKVSRKHAGEWIAALGANVGLALVLREGARAALKFLPVWGDVVSGGIAAAGTYAVGKAASAYFIEGVSLAQAQKLFRERRKAPEQLGRGSRDA